MAAATHLPIPVSEYLQTSYRPDCDYVDGVIEERNLGEFDHASVQGAILKWFLQHENGFSARAYPELRVQVAPTRYRVADICVIANSAPREQIVETPPLAVLEVLSPQDRVARTMVRLEDYRRMGIRNIWVVDPAERRAFDFSSGRWIETEAFADPHAGIRLDLAALFVSMEDDGVAPASL